MPRASRVHRRWSRLSEIAQRAWARMAEPWILTIAVVTALALLVRLWGIGDQSYWYDESFTVDETRMRFLRMLAMVRDQEVTPPLYFVAAWNWGKLFGTGEAGLRSLSAIAGALTVPAVAACAVTLAGRRAAVIAAALIAANPLLIWYSQEARSYALTTLLAALSWLFFLRAVRSGRARELVLWALASSLLIFTHYFGIFLVGPEVAWMLWRLRRRAVAWRCAAAIAAVGLWLLPFAVLARGAGWVHGIPLGLRLRQIPEQLAAGFSNSSVVAVGTSALVALAVLMLTLTGDRRARRAATVAFATAAVIVVEPFLLGRAGLDYLVTRNVIFVTVPLAVLVAAGLSVARHRWMGVLAAIAICGFGATAVGRIQSSDALQRPEWRALARGLGPPHGNRAILVAGRYRGRPLKLYLHATRLAASPAPAVGEIDVVGMRSPHGAGCWWGAECNLPSAFPSPLPPPPDFRLLSRRRIGDFIVSRFLSPHSVALDVYSDVYRSPRRFRGRQRHPVTVLFQRSDV